MKVGSIFSGIGGFDEGLRRAGMHTAWLCEIDKAAQSVLYRRFPDAMIYDDVTTLGGDIERVDLICGGFPCQDLSVAGRRAGLAGDRSGLWYQFHRILSELTPRWVLIENVPGLLSSEDGRDFAIVLSGLVELGYGVAWRILDAQYFGVAQRRRRVFIVGCLGDGSRAAQVLFEPESLPGNPAPSREAGKGTAGEPAACLNSGGNNGGFRTEPGEHLVAGTLAANAGPGSHDAGNFHCNQAVDAGYVIPVAHSLTSEGFDASEDGTGRGVPITTHPPTLQIDGQGLCPYCRCMRGKAVIEPHKRGCPAQGLASITHALTAEGFDASEDGTGRGTPLVTTHSLTVQHGTTEDGTGRGVPIVTTATLTSNGDAHSGFRTAEGIVSVAQNQRGELRTAAISPQLTCGGGKPGEGYPCVAFNWQSGGDVRLGIKEERTDALHSSQTPAVAIAMAIPFDTTQITSAANYSNPKPDDPCHPLASGAHAPAIAMAFSAGNSADAYGIALTEEGTPPLRAAESGTNQVPSVQYGTAVRRLTPTECERLQGFPDGWTASGALSVRPIGYTDEDSLRRLIRWHGTNAQLRDAIGHLLTGSMESASCITSDSRNTELLISRNASSDMDSNAKSASVWWEARVPEDCVRGTISPGSDTPTLCDQRLIKFAAPRITSGHTLLSLLPVLAENSAPGSSSITSTWTDEITNLLTSMFSPTLPVICEPTTRSIDWSSDSSKRALFALRMVNTANQSDSARYRQLGNAVCVPVAEWIGRRIVEVAS